jgi:hypothetical protein
VQPDAAVWIRATVWTPALRKSYTETPNYYAECACTWGPSGHCDAGQHQRCQTVSPEPRPETYICQPNGSVVGDAVQVWLAGHACRWRCPCRCHTGLPDLAPVEMVGALQYDLFAT